MRRTVPHAGHIPNSLSRIVLLGFMGAGKSTVGRLLANRLGWAFHDSDEALEQHTGLSIAELFARHGEAGFRALEMEAVAELMRHELAVIALGGGAIESPATRTLLSSQADTCTVFLDAPLQTMLDRCQVSAAVRPVLQDRDAIPERYERRLPHYRAATLTISTQGLTPESVVEMVYRRLSAPPILAQTAGQAKGQSQ